MSDLVWRCGGANATTIVDCGRVAGAKFDHDVVHSDLEVNMALQFLGKDSESPNGHSPTVYYDDERDTYVLQGYKVEDEARLAQMKIPEHETVIEFPKRMMQFFPEVTSG
jgi:hypothetical protein